MWAPRVTLIGLLSLTWIIAAQDSECEDHVGVAGSGRGTEIRWSYVQADKSCKAFLQREEGKSRNSFSTEIECMRRCSEEYNRLYPPGDAVCALPQDAGPCMAMIFMWYYDAERQVCDSFLYSGCQGNGNRFENRINCTNLCVPLKKGKSGGTNLSEEHSSQTDEGLIVGIVCGIVFGAAFLVTLGLYLVQRKKLKKQEHKRVPDVELR
ncbi:inter-alpha-trypsin inhibitor-like [Rhinophrynus dorsalis]